MKAWLLWFLICAVVLLAAFIIALAAAIESPRFHTASVQVTVLYVLGALTILTALFVIEEWYRVCKRLP